MGVEYEHFILPRYRDFRPATDGVARLVEALRRERWVLTADHPLFDELRNGFGTPRGIDDTTGGYAQLFGPNANAPRRSRPRSVVVPRALDAAFLDAQLDAVHPSPLAREIHLGFPVYPSDAYADWDELELEYPFTHGGEDTSNYHQIEIVLADDFVSHLSNAFDPIDDACACGAALGYRPDDDVPELTAAHDLDARIRRTCPKCGARFEPRRHVARARRGWDASTYELEGGITYRFGVRIDCHKGWPREHGPLVLRPELRELVEGAVGALFEDAGGLY